MYLIQLPLIEIQHLNSVIPKIFINIKRWVHEPKYINMGYRDKHIYTKSYLTIYKAIIALRCTTQDWMQETCHFSNMLVKYNQEYRKQIGTKQSTYHIYQSQHWFLLFSTSPNKLKKKIHISHISITTYWK